MTSELLREACEQAACCHSGSLLHLARVFARFHQPEAESMVEAGIPLTHQLSDGTTIILLEEAAFLAAAVSPKQALAAHASIRDKHESPDNPVDRLIINMVTHGHVSDAIAHFNNPLPVDEFSLDLVNSLAATCKDDATRLDLLHVLSAHGANQNKASLGWQL